MRRNGSAWICHACLLLVLTATIDTAAAQSRRHGGGSGTAPGSTGSGSGNTPSVTGATGASDATPPPPGARELFLEGQQAYQRGDYAGAIALWEQAVAIDPRPQLHYNLAQAYGRLGRIEDEMSSLRHFLDGAPPNDPSVASTRDRLASLEQRLAQTGIILSGSYEGARVVIDGQERGTMPHPEALTVRSGSHSVDVFLDGYDPFHAAVAVPAGDQVTVTVVLVRGHEVGTSHPMRLPIALYISGGVLAATGATIGTLALIRGRSSVETTPDGDRARTLSIVADATLIPGLAIGATGLVVHLLRRGHDDESAEHPVTVVPVVGLNHIGVAGTF